MANSHRLVLLCFVLLASVAAATQFKVGGSKWWSLPDPNSMSFNQWADKNRFQIGDSLLFVYLPDQDSVLLVDANAYNNCDTSSFTDHFDDGNTVFTFTRSGSFYFISRNKDNCQKNEKLVVVVMASRGNGTSPAPSPSPVSTSPPAPPSGVVEPVPQLAPAGESTTPPPNGASVKVVGFMGRFGALLVTFYCVFQVSFFESSCF